LRSDGFSNERLLNVNSLLRKIDLAISVPKGHSKHAANHCKGRTRSHAAASRQVAVMMNFEPTLNLHLLENGSDNRVLNLSGFWAASILE
jgi:hypothetical protein